MPRSNPGSRFAPWGMAISVLVLSAAGLAASPPGGSGPDPSPDSKKADSYALSMGENSMSTNLSLDEYIRLREKRSDDFLWFRRAGKAYIVEDPATLTEARGLFAPLRELEPEQERLRQREEALNEKEQELDAQQEEIEREMDRLTGRDGDTEADEEDESMAAEASEEEAPPTEAERAQIEKELEELHSRQDALRPRLDQIKFQSDELEAVERSLEAREEKLEKEAEAKLWVLIDAALQKGLAKPSTMP